MQFARVFDGTASFIALNMTRGGGEDVVYLFGRGHRINFAATRVRRTIGTTAPPTIVQYTLNWAMMVVVEEQTKEGGTLFKLPSGYEIQRNEIVCSISLGRPSPPSHSLQQFPHLL